MIFLLRWLIILILLVLAAMSLFPAVIGTIETYHLPVDLTPISGASENLKAWAASTTIWERVLWYAAAVFFFISSIRLIRKTQGFWMWLLGFACYGARWGLGQYAQDGGLVGTVQGLTVQSFAPATLASGGSSAQLTFLVFLLVIGLLIFVIDHADREYWDRQGA